MKELTLCFLSSRLAGNLPQRLVIVTSILCFMASSAPAQLGGVDAEFAGAGARAMAMGGAFIGLGDDATAAEFNPAGLQILRRPELAWQATYTFDEREEFYPHSLRRGSDENEWFTPSFVSYVHPGEKFTWAISQLTTVNFVHEFSDAAEGVQGDLSTEATNNAFGLSFATDLAPRLHAGLTLRMNRFDYDFTWNREFGPPFGDDAEVFQEDSFDDWSPSFNLGLLWRTEGDWSFGAVYKSRQAVQTSGVETHLPQTFGIGAAYQPNDRVRVLIDVDHITWSDFDSRPSDAFVRDDVNRYHLGGEYLFCLEEERAWFVRGGVMHEDSNALYYTDPRFPELLEGFPKEDPKNHLSFGVGLATEKYQIDLAVDHVLDGGTTCILSMVHYF